MTNVHQEVAHLYLPTRGEGKKHHAKGPCKRKVRYKGYGDVGYLYLLSPRDRPKTHKQEFIEEIISYKGPAIILDLTKDNELLGIEVVDFYDEKPVIEKSLRKMLKPSACTTFNTYYGTSPCDRIPKTITTPKTKDPPPRLFIFFRIPKKRNLTRSFCRLRISRV